MPTTAISTDFASRLITAIGTFDGIVAETRYPNEDSRNFLIKRSRPTDENPDNKITEATCYVDLYDGKVTVKFNLIYTRDTRRYKWEGKSPVEVAAKIMAVADQIRADYDAERERRAEVRRRASEAVAIQNTRRDRLREALGDADSVDFMGAGDTYLQILNLTLDQFEDIIEGLELLAEQREDSPATASAATQADQPSA